MPGADGDLADVLDLGADPPSSTATDEALAARARAAARAGRTPPSAVTTATAVRTSSPTPVPGGREGGDTDVVLGQLHYTLDLLERGCASRRMKVPRPTSSISTRSACRRCRDGQALGRREVDPDPLSLPDPTPTPTPPGEVRRDPTERLGHQPAGEIGPDASRPPSRFPLVTDDHPRRRAALSRIADRSIAWRCAAALNATPRPLHRRAGARQSRGRRLWFREGDIVQVRSNAGHDRLLDGLLTAAFSPASSTRSPRQLAAKGPGARGRSWSRRASSQELPRVLRDHVIRVIDSTFPVDDGR